MSTVFPAIDFPLFGLDDGWTGPRWMPFFGGQAGLPTWGVHLAHGRQEDLWADRGPWVVVVTRPRRRYEGAMGIPPRSLEETLAFDTGFSLLSHTNADVPALEEVARRHDEWPDTSWNVEGRAVAARLAPASADARGAADDAWAGYSTVHPAVYLQVLARGVSPEDIRLTPVINGLDYHLDLRAPLDYPEVLARSSSGAFDQI